MSRYTLHLTPADYFNSLDTAQDYVAPTQAEEGFMHTTEGAANLRQVANAFYRDDPRDFLVLYIDKGLVRSPIRYDDPSEVYPHIYGPLNRDAIVRIAPAPRETDGTFLPVPEPEEA